MRAIEMYKWLKENQITIEINHFGTDRKKLFLHRGEEANPYVTIRMRRVDDDINNVAEAKGVIANLVTTLCCDNAETRAAINEIRWKIKRRSNYNNGFIVWEPVHPPPPAYKLTGVEVELAEDAL